MTTLKRVLISIPILFLLGCSIPTTEYMAPEVVKVDSKYMIPSEIYEEEVVEMIMMGRTPMYQTNRVERFIPEKYFLVFISGEYESQVEVDFNTYRGLERGDEIVVREVLTKESDGSRKTTSFQLVE